MGEAKRTEGTKEERLTFALSPFSDGSGRLLIIGISDAAEAVMSTGERRTHNLDFRRIGMPLAVMMFREPTRAHILDKLNLFNTGKPVFHELRDDAFKLPEDERESVKMRERARAYMSEENEGVGEWARHSDEWIDGLIKAILSKG